VDKEKKIVIPLLNAEGDYEEASVFFYDMTPSGKGLDFEEISDQKADFLMYTIQLNCINSIRDITKSPLPSLGEIARGTSIQLGEVIKKGTQARRDLGTTLGATGT
jgi:hypothetical protein